MSGNMFNDLKENITEDVKISPQPFEEFTPTIGNRLRNSRSSDDNFLSLKEDDDNASANTTRGFSSVTLLSQTEETEDNRSRRLSNSSKAVDTLFSPEYESHLDILASEIENKASTTDRMESLTQKCNGLESELAKVHSYKIELENCKQNEETLKKQIEELQKLNSALLSENEGLLCLKPRIGDKLQQDCLENQEQLENQFTQKLNEPASSSLNYTSVQILEKDKLLKKHVEDLESPRTELSEKSESCNNLEKNHLILFEKCIKHNTNANLEKDKIYVEKCADKIAQLDADIKTLQGEVEHIKDIAQNKEEENVYLSNENMNLKRNLTKVNGKLRILEEKYEAVGMNSTENKLLLLKLQKLEEEKNNMLSEFEMERKMFNDILEDHNELKKKESYLELLKNELKGCSNKVSQLKKYLTEEKEQNVKLDDKKLQLEREINDLMKKLRIFEEKDETKHMNKTECGILEMKLKKLENKNQELLLAFQQEREVYERDMQALRQKITVPEQNQAFTNEKHLLLDIQKLNKNKDKEIVYLSDENAKLQQTDIELFRKLKLLQGKYETVNVNNYECGLLELKLKKEEEKNNRLKVEFEMERKVFCDLLRDHNEIHNKNRFIEKLEHKLCQLHIEKKDLKHSLTIEEKKNIQLEHNRTALEHEIVKMGEHNKILEEKDEFLCMDRTEGHLIKIKFQKSEMENKNLQDMFEQERIIFDKVYKEKSVQEKEVKHLLNELKDKKEQEMINDLRTKVNNEIESMNSTEKTK